jgi:hypothetical protein
MAIQLNDRDQLIFKLIEEHEVLLEKHISWFLADKDKPVLIRDRLRKLFYLDYLICHRHGSKLPWWTTPTKPLVYILSPMARTLSGMEATQVEVFDNNFQRHHLEVANLRMLYLVAQKASQIDNFTWKTIKAEEKKATQLDAIASYNAGGTTLKVGLVNSLNNLNGQVETLEKLEKAISAQKLDSILVTSRDETSQKVVQELVKKRAGNLRMRTFFATHHELYKDGIVGTHWQTADSQSFTPTTHNQIIPPVAYMAPGAAQPLAI